MCRCPSHGFVANWSPPTESFDVGIGGFRRNRCTSSSSAVFPLILARIRASSSPEDASLSGRRPRRSGCLFATPLPPAGLCQPPTRTTSSLSASNLIAAPLCLSPCVTFVVSSRTPPVRSPQSRTGKQCLVAAWAATICCPLNIVSVLSAGNIMAQYTPCSRLGAIRLHDNQENGEKSKSLFTSDGPFVLARSAAQEASTDLWEVGIVAN